MLSQYERWIHVHQVGLEARPQIDDVADLNTVLTHISPRVRSGEAVKVINANTAAIRLSKLRLRDDRAEMLVQYADTTVTDPAFSELGTGKLRVEPKLEGEGIAVSAHAVISTVPSPSGRYLCMVEHVPGLPSSRISELLTHLIKEFVALEFTDVDDQTKSYRMYPRFDGLLRQRLADDLENGGYLSEIELYDDGNDAAPIDEDPFFEKRRSVQVKIKNKPTGDIAAAIIQRVRGRYAPMGYTKMRIRLRTDGVTKGVVVPPHLEQALEAVSIRQHPYKSKTPLPQCAERLNGLFVAAMWEKLQEEFGG